MLVIIFLYSVSGVLFYVGMIALVTAVKKTQKLYVQKKSSLGRLDWGGQ